VLLNKVDRFGPTEERAAAIEELTEYVEDNAAGRIAGCFALSALEALEAQSSTPEQPTPGTASLRLSGFENFRDFLESHIVERSGRIKTLEIARQLGELVDDLGALQDELVDKYEALGDEASSLSEWLDEHAHTQPEARAKAEARSLEDRFDFVLTGIEREIREAMSSRGRWLTRKVLADEDKQFVLDLLSERLEDVLNRSRQTVENGIAELESNLAQRVGQIVGELPLSDARAMNRRLEGFFDESRVLKLLLEERVYGQMRARATGQIEAAGRRALEEIGDSSQHDGRDWKTALRRLLPDTRADLNRELAAWYAEFFLAASRFCDRVQRDLHLLKLEAEHHFDVSSVAELASGR
jgi:nitrate reductase assembly molybdenum cofactor insertion protein NarJ